MMDRLPVLFCFVAAAAAAAFPAAVPQHANDALQPANVVIQPAQIAVPAAAAKLVYAEQESPAQYEYEYSVKDPHSGDDKQIKENRFGDEVRGFYAFVQPDGVRRIVEYSSSKEHGFNAVVRYEGQPAPAPARVAYAAQAPVRYTAALTAPVAYAPPQATVAYAQTQDPQITYAPAPVTQAYYAPSRPVPITFNPVQAAPVKYTQARINYNPTAAAQAIYEVVPSSVAYASVPSPFTYATQVQPTAAGASVQRIAYVPAARIAHTQANVAFAAEPQVVHSQAQSAPAAPVTYAQAPLAKLSPQPDPFIYTAAPVAKLVYAQPTGHITYAH